MLDLSDLQVLEKVKEVKSYDREVNEILDRILKLNEAHPEHYEDTRGMSEVVRNRKQNLLENISDLRESLNR